MKNISGQYQDLLEGKMNKAQFLRNARMMFPNFVTNHNSFDDSVAILKQKGMLNEGDAVKGTPDKEPTYDSLTPDDKIKYKKVEQSPEVDEQDGIYPATTITDIPKTKTYKKVKNTSDGLEPIKDNDTKNEMKKVKVVKENMAPEEIETAEVEISQNRSSIQAMADKMGISQEELFKLLLKKLGGLDEARFKKGTDIGKPGKGFEKIAKAAGKEYGSEEAGKRVAGAILNKVLNKEIQMNEIKTAPDAQAVISLIGKNTMLLNKLKMINNKEELQPVFDFLLTKINQTIAKNTQQVKTATTTSAQNYSKMGSVTEKIAPKLESLITKVMNETLLKKSAK
jgi:hypothetical protein